MARYSKLTSNYTLKKVHQHTDDGTIFERDWTTLGERHVIERGKKKVYGNSGFIFTDNTRKGLRRRNYSGEWSDTFTLDDLSGNVNSSVNQIELSDSNDIRDYAYWGSAEELLRSTVENIIKWFPGRIWTTSSGIIRVNSSGEYQEYIQDIVNDGHGNYRPIFINSDIVGTSCDDEEIEPPCVNFNCNDEDNTCIQFDCNTVYRNSGCCVRFSDGVTESRRNECIKFECDGDCDEFEDRCDNSIHIYRVMNPFLLNLFNKDSYSGKYDNRLRNLAVSWKQYVINGTPLTGYNVYIKPYNECDEDYTVEYAINIECGNRTIAFYGLKLGKDILWCSDTPNISIQPKTVLIENYFSNLEGLERILLDRRSYPWYTAKFITPIDVGTSRYFYAERIYRWPSTDYAIDVDTLGFESYINELYSLGKLMDELWCDNLWNNMTHEAIKNFDWTYTREYEVGDEDDNIAGGTRMEHLIKLTGAYFDDIKRYVDGIGKKNNITRDGINNLPNAEMSDKAALLGWEVYSTKQNENTNMHISLSTLDWISKLPSRWDDTSIIHGKWYDNYDITKISENENDNYFMRNLALNSSEIFRTKGTKHCIEMVMGMFGFGDSDYELIEQYYNVVPRLADDILYYYSRNNDIPMEVENGEYQLISDFSSLDEYLASKDFIIGSEDADKIRFSSDGLNIYYDKSETTYRDAAVLVNASKNIERNYENEPFSGVPLNDVFINNQHYIVPYFTQEMIYDGDVQFETNGGWGKFIKTGDDIYEEALKQYDYLESAVYIDTLQNCSELTQVNMYEIEDKRIYYVMDLSDYADYNSDVPTDGNLSHYFKLIDIYNPQDFDSWKNIPFKIATSDGIADVSEAFEGNPNGYKNYCNSFTAFEGITYDDYLLASYYDTLNVENIGNNPHCGFGRYDLGTQYYNYLVSPFSFSIENYAFETEDIGTIAKLFRFEVSTVYGNKLVNRIEDTEDNYYMPSKLLIMKNNIDSYLYRDYFKNIILKYLLQVIPSTTILVLEDF